MEEVKKVIKKVEDDRRQEIEAFIVRTMKENKELPQKELET